MSPMVFYGVVEPLSNCSNRRMPVGTLVTSRSEVAEAEEIVAINRITNDLQGSGPLA
jgi:hypothetical protein